MARAFDLPKRGALPRSRSSLSKGILASATTGKRKAASIAEQQHQQTKAEKRTKKHDELIKRTLGVDKSSSSSSGSLPPYLLSKSAARRRKRREREQLGANGEGMQDVANAVEEVSMLAEQSQREAELAAKVGAPPPGTTTRPDMAGAGQDGSGAKDGSKAAISAKQRKKVLAEELGRQQHILADPAFSKSPFAALRQHARNALAFSQEPPTE